MPSPTTILPMFRRKINGEMARMSGPRIKSADEAKMQSFLPILSAMKPPAKADIVAPKIAMLTNF